MAAANENVQQQLIQAIFWGNLDNVKTAIREGANVNGTDFGAGAEWQKPLLWAAIQGKEEITIHLIQEGAVVNVSTVDGRTPLHYAALEQQNELIALLISKGAAINAQDSSGATPLHLAAEKEGPAMATLIQLGAQQDLLNRDNKTAAQLNAERIQRVSIPGATPEGTISAAFWARLTANSGPLTPEERHPNEHTSYQSRGFGG